MRYSLVSALIAAAVSVGHFGLLGYIDVKVTDTLSLFKQSVSDAIDVPIEPLIDARKGLPNTDVTDNLHLFDKPALTL